MSGPASLITMAGKMITAIRQDDDFADRLNFRYTVGILVIFSVFTTTKQYIGQPINCWAPAHFSKVHISYANDHCWVRNTYYLPLDQHIPKDGKEAEELPERGGHVITYYQWAPLLLLVQAFMFALPSLIWQNFGDNSGVDVGNFITVGQMLATVQMEASVREKLVKKMVRQLDRYLLQYSKEKSNVRKATWFTLSAKHVFNRLSCFAFGRHRTNYLVTLYMLTKLLYIANAVGQLFLLNWMLGTNYHSYGVEVLHALANGLDWTQSPRFPRITMCDMRVRRLGAVHRYTIQCVLPINLFNEKIYLFLWFWFAFVAAASCVTAVVWLLRFVIKVDRHRYVNRYLNLAGKVAVKPVIPPGVKHSLSETTTHRRQKQRYDECDKHKMFEFNENYIRHDGAFMLRQLTSAANPLTALDVTGALWDYYWKTHEAPAERRRRTTTTTTTTTPLSASAPPPDYDEQATLHIRDEKKAINNNEWQEG